jgi:hypothetical protein
MKFVCPAFAAMKLLDFSRLYAFPRKPGFPPDDGIVVCDSGAWSLSHRADARMSEDYMYRLAEHYRRYQSERVYCIAPDEYLNPQRTMKNWLWWTQNVPDVLVVPVIQFERVKRLDLAVVVRQARFYAPFEPSFLAISNPGLRAIESELMPQICDVVRKVTGAHWLHNLGAGWSPRDVREWRELGCFDSLDSIAYYTDAQDGWKWRVDGKRAKSTDDWRDLAHGNARVAVSIAE